jgi:ribosomal protein L37AE/L43A
MVKNEKKACYKCKERKLKSEMTLLGVWVCNKCIKNK